MRTVPVFTAASICSPEAGRQVCATEATVQSSKPAEAMACTQVDAVGELEHVRPDGQAHLHRAAACDGAEHGAKELRPLGRVPDGEGQPAAGPQHAPGLAEEALGLREMQHAVVAHHSIEGGVLEGQLPGIGLEEAQLRIASTRRVHLLGREVASGDPGTAVQRGGGRVAGARCHVQDWLPAPTWAASSSAPMDCVVKLAR